MDDDCSARRAATEGGGAGDGEAGVAAAAPATAMAAAARAAAEVATGWGCSTYAQTPPSASSRRTTIRQGADGAARPVGRAHVLYVKVEVVLAARPDVKRLGAALPAVVVELRADAVLREADLGVAGRAEYTLGVAIGVLAVAAAA